MILPSDTDVVVSLDARWIFGIVQLKLGLESQLRLRAQVRKRATLFSGGFPRGAHLVLSHQHTFSLCSLPRFLAEIGEGGGEGP